jgi:hypothetical protein
MNLNPNVWGPHGWFFLDSIVLSMPNNLSYEQKIIYKNFFTSLKDVLPCAACREHYKENLIKFPLTDIILSKKENIIRWILSVHNNVRKNDEKKTQISIEQYFKYYNKQYDENYNKNKNKNKTNKECNLKYYISIIIILILILIIFYKFKS